MPVSIAEKTSERLKEYREAAIGASDRNPERQNEWARRVHESYKALRETEAGKKGIIALMSDPSPYVRLWAASHSLQWVPENAQLVLEALRDSGGPGSFTAKWTLIQFKGGKLSFDY
jgi:hypothetical protein